MSLKKYTIERTERLAMLEIGVVVATSFILVLVTQRILSLFNGITSNNMDGVILMSRLFILLVAAVAVFASWKYSRLWEYYIEDKSLVIIKHGLARHPAKKVVPIDSRPFLNLSYTFFGRLLGYGTLTMKIKKYASEEEYILTGIKNPAKTIAEIQKLFVS